MKPLEIHMISDSFSRDAVDLSEYVARKIYIHNHAKQLQESETAGADYTLAAAQRVPRWELDQDTEESIERSDLHHVSKNPCRTLSQLHILINSRFDGGAGRPGTF